MMKYSLFVLLIFFTHIKNGTTQNITAQEVLAKSQKYHDPAGLLTTSEVHLFLNEPRPSGGDRKSTLVIDTQREFFSSTRKTAEHEKYLALEKGVFSATLDGKSEFTPEEIDKHKLTAKRTQLLKNYYEYLWLLPIKLSDPGTIIANQVMVKDFFGKTGYEIKATYTEEVGKDTWYFYFDQSTYAMIGYRFYHDESKNDGEYILINGEVSDQGVRIPAERKWYKHQKDEYLGMDILEKIEIRERRK